MAFFTLGEKCSEHQLKISQMCLIGNFRAVVMLCNPQQIINDKLTFLNVQHEFHSDIFSVKHSCAWSNDPYQENHA